MAICKHESCNEKIPWLAGSDQQGFCEKHFKEAFPPCLSCGHSKVNETFTDGYCRYCLNKKHEAEAEQAEIKRAEAEKKAIASIQLTTETVAPFPVEERLGIIAAEVVFGQNLIKDFFTGVRDIVGGRAGATQKVLKDAKAVAFDELRREAYELGANAVVAIDLDYNEISNGTMVMLVVNGTAVKAKL